ncbi:MAG TPA: phage tail sheath C-terminal domain-containing protein [Alphaproteobacteria bacterium]|nr:phage tail sheath C-terminal domain-containing protein [Alphaproteobacteria bacterium]
MKRTFLSIVAGLVTACLAQPDPLSAQLSQPQTQPSGRAGSGTQKLNVYVAGLKTKLTQMTQFASTRSNDEKLWANVRQTIDNFLRTEWRAGKLQGTKPEEAFFVKCDRSTMTQTDIDNGRLICQVGVAPVRPAEFVMIRITQWTSRKTKPMRGF